MFKKITVSSLFPYLIFFLTALLFFSIVKRDNSVVYGDSGYMWIQSVDLQKTNFSSFAFQYPGQSFDREGLFLPFTAPFIGGYQGKFYIDFPPYFPVFIAIPQLIFSNTYSVYMFQLVFAAIYLTSFFGILRSLGISKLESYILTFVMLFCTTVFTYNLAIHEYSIGLGFLYFGFFCLLKAVVSLEDLTPKQNVTLNQKILLLVSAISFGISLFFRLEFIFSIFSWIFVFFLFQRISFRDSVLWFGLGFLSLLGILFYWNYTIHGHPLGFRYTLTMNNPHTVDIPRSEILWDLYFGKLRGFFYQSPYLIIFLVIGIVQLILDRFKNGLPNRMMEIFLSISCLSAFAVSLTAPNHGDHLSPRYLFGIYPALFLFCYFSFEKLFSKSNSFVRIGILSLLVLAFFFSGKQLFKNIKFIKESDQFVRQISDIVAKQPESKIVLLDQVLAKNLQTIHFQKDFYFTDLSNIPKFFEKSGFSKADVLFLSSIHTDNCYLGGTVCEDRSGVLNLKFYKSK